MRRRSLTLLLVPAILLVARPASAHVEPTTTVVPSGSTSTVEFTVQHGCEGSPTTKVEFQVPSQISDAAPVDKDGWTGEIVDGVVTYSGGTLPDDVEDTFAVRFTASVPEGTTLAFPFIQTCEEGSLEWIQLGEDVERPAPLVEVGPADPNATTTAPAPATTEAPGSSTTEASTTAPTSPTATTEAGTADEEAGTDAGDSSAGIVVIGVLLVTAAVVIVVIRRRSAEK